MFVFLVHTKSNAQSEKVVSKLDTITNTYQYRITFNQVQDNVGSTSLVEHMTDYFKTKIEYNKDLNQYIFLANKNMEQSELSHNFSQEITFFKKILINLNVSYEKISE